MVAVNSRVRFWLASTPSSAYPYGDAFSVGTVAIQVGKEIWVGAA